MTDIELGKSPPPSGFLHELPACDIVMQLDNMLEGGLENVVIDLAHALEEWGYSVAILVLGATGEGTRKAVRSGLHVCVFPYNEEALRQELERSRPKAVFAHYSFQGAHLYDCLGIPFIQVLHNVYAWFDGPGKEMFAKAARQTALFVAVSETVKEYSVKHLGVAAGKCLTIPNGIDLSRFTPEARQEAQHLRKQLGFSQEDFVFVAIASINRLKRVLALVKGLRCICDLAPRARLVLLGYPYDAEYLDEIRTYIDKNGLQDRVSYVGHSTTPELYCLMADAFVHAAGVEGGPLVLLEALAANLAVVTTNVGFVRHFIPYPGITVVDRDFPYSHESFTSEALRPSSALVADLALAMLRTCRSNIRPNLPHDVIAAFDATRTYARYEQLIAGILKRPPQTEPVADWVELLPEPPADPVVPLSPSEKDVVSTVRAIAAYEASVAEYDAQLAGSNARLAERTVQFTECDAQLTERNAQLAECAARLAECDARIQGLLHSRSWRVTAPLRAVDRFMRTSKPSISE